MSCRLSLVEKILHIHSKYLFVQLSVMSLRFLFNNDSYLHPLVGGQATKYNFIRLATMSFLSSFSFNFIQTYILSRITNSCVTMGRYRHLLIFLLFILTIGLNCFLISCHGFQKNQIKVLNKCKILFHFSMVTTQSSTIFFYFTYPNFISLHF